LDVGVCPKSETHDETPFTIPRRCITTSIYVASGVSDTQKKEISTGKSKRLFLPVGQKESWIYFSGALQH
jgi:hypothetical protein